MVDMAFMSQSSPVASRQFYRSIAELVGLKTPFLEPESASLNRADRPGFRQVQQSGSHVGFPPWEKLRFFVFSDPIRDKPIGKPTSQEVHHATLTPDPTPQDLRLGLRPPYPAIRISPKREIRRRRQTISPRSPFRFLIKRRRPPPLSSIFRKRITNRLSRNFFRFFLRFAGVFRL